MPPAPLLAPRFWAFHLVALLAVGLAGWLGYWQYDAWQQRRADEARDLTHAEPEPIADVMGSDDRFPGRKIGQPVVLEGTWVPDGTVYVTGREGPGGTDGAWVVTPLAVGSGADDPAMLVVRGWVSSADLGPDPALPAPTGRASLVGWLQPPEGSGVVDEDPADDVLPQLRIADALQHVDQDLYGAYAVVVPEEERGDWPGGPPVNDGTAGLTAASLDQLAEVGRFTAVRNLLYAVEWWVFGLFAAFIWWRWARDETGATRDAVAAGAVDSA
ncbi:MAG TPA: SURF1 family protein [Intrasporangium sp.]|nr:SURF1 family protein [Intrasporangium sp.]